MSWFRFVENLPEKLSLKFMFKNETFKKLIKNDKKSVILPSLAYKSNEERRIAFDSQNL